MTDRRHADPTGSAVDPDARDRLRHRHLGDRRGDGGRPPSAADRSTPTPPCSDDVATDPAYPSARTPGPTCRRSRSRSCSTRPSAVLVLVGRQRRQRRRLPRARLPLAGRRRRVVDVPAVDDDSLLPQPERDLPVPDPGGRTPRTRQILQRRAAPRSSPAPTAPCPTSASTRLTPPAEPTEPAEDLAPPVEGQ